MYVYKYIYGIYVYTCMCMYVYTCVYYVSKYLYTHKNFEIAENAFLSTIYLICTFKSNEAII